MNHVNIRRRLLIWIQRNRDISAKHIGAMTRRRDRHIISRIRRERPRPRLTVVQNANNDTVTRIGRRRRRQRHERIRTTVIRQIHIRIRQRHVTVVGLRHRPHHQITLMDHGRHIRQDRHDRRRMNHVNIRRVTLLRIGWERDVESGRRIETVPDRNNRHIGGRRRDIFPQPGLAWIQDPVRVRVTRKRRRRQRRDITVIVVIG